jgi:hypothetical protein
MEQVVVLLLLDAALVAGLRPAALVVLAVDVVLDPVGLREVLAGTGEQARAAPVDEQDAPALGGPLLDQRLDEGPALDDHARAQRAAQGDDLEQPGRGAGVHRHRARAVGGDVVAVQHLAHALDVAAQGLALVVLEGPGLGLGLVRGVGHDRGDRAGARGRGGELRRVEVQEDREDAAAIRVHVGQSPQELAGDRGGCHALGATPLPARRNPGV